jgi:butyryl-CoA dehydrogenase
VDFAFTAEHDRFLAAVREFAQERVAPRAAEIDETAVYPIDLVREAAALGLLGVTISPDHGGSGRDYVAYAAAIEEIAAASATLAVILSVHNSLVAEPIQEFGSELQKGRWLRALATGQAIGAFALSERNSGSDAASQQTSARLDAEGGAFTIDGEKVWVTNGEVADVIMVFACTRAGERGRGISAFLVPSESAGLERRPSPDSLGVRGLGCVEIGLHGVHASPDALLGAADQGFALAKRALDGGRIAIAAQALGVGRASLTEALQFAKRRQAFGHPISVFQSIQFQLADVATELEAARALTWKAADARDRRPHATVEASMAKLQASEAAHRAADRGLQILASEGYRKGSVIERLFRDIRAAEIYQGTSEVQRMIIARAVVDHI